MRRRETVILLMNFLLHNCKKKGFRIVEFSIQGNHLHLLCEAESKEALSKAMNGFLSTLARRLNSHWSRKGKVFADRYHAQAILTPTQCRHALIYVLANAKKHGALPSGMSIDPCSTAPWFPFDPQPTTPSAIDTGSHPANQAVGQPRARYPKPAATPQTWLLRQGWRKIAPITAHDHPLKKAPPKQKRRTALRQ